MTYGLLRHITLALSHAFPRVRYLCWLRSSTRLLPLLLSALCCYIQLVVTWPTTHTWTPLVYAPFVTTCLLNSSPPYSPCVIHSSTSLPALTLFLFGNSKVPPPFFYTLFSLLVLFVPHFDPPFPRPLVLLCLVLLFHSLFLPSVLSYLTVIVSRNKLVYLALNITVLLLLM